MFEILIPVLIAGGTIGALLLSKRPTAPARAYEVAVLGIDESKTFTITALGEGKAVLTSLVISCKQLDGTFMVFNILAGQIPKAVPGAGNLSFPAAAIYISNEGTVDDTLFIRVKDAAGVQIGYWEAFVIRGGSLGNTAISFAMPTRDYTLIVEVGHL